MADSTANIQHWQMYKLVFHLRSPLHIGYRVTENIQYTRRYVLAKTIWGALTAAISKSREDRGYDQLVEDLKAHLRFSYFYLCEQENGEDAMLPKYGDGGLTFGHYPKERFEQRFVDSYASTAIDPASKTAQEKSLHEIEILTDYCRDEQHTPVFLIGYVFEQIDSDGSEWATRLEDHDWKRHIRDIRLGGERKYGFGRLDLIVLDLLPEGASLFGRYETDLKNPETPVVCVSKAKPFPAHVLMNQSLCIIQGETEVLVSRETLQLDKWGGHVTKPLSCFCPGCTGFEGRLGFSNRFILETSTTG